MPSRLFRAILVGAAVAAVAGPSAAHTYVLSRGDAASSTGYFGVICSTDGGYETDHLFLQILTQTAGAPMVSVQVIKGAVATNTTDPVGGDALPSAPIRLRGGNGLYQVLVNKTGPGLVVFTATAHCLDASGTQHTGTDAVVYQYQDR